MSREEFLLSVLLQEDYPDLQKLDPLLLINKYLEKLRYWVISIGNKKFLYFVFIFGVSP